MNSQLDCSKFRVPFGCLLIALLGAFLSGTGQEGDLLSYNQKVFTLLTNPLESYYVGEQKRPRFNIEPNTISSGNWRGYVAHWSIQDGTLYLVKIDSWIPEQTTNLEENSTIVVNLKWRRADLRELFGEKCQDGRVEADWFTGELRIPDGELLRYAHMGYGSVYERDIILTVVKGKITKEEIIDHTKENIPWSLELERRELEKLKPN